MIIEYLKGNDWAAISDEKDIEPKLEGNKLIRIWRSEGLTRYIRKMKDRYIGIEWRQGIVTNEKSFNSASNVINWLLER